MALGKLGKYERVDVLGHGASGIVYLAWDTMLKKQVALKEIDLQAGDVERFLEEARVMDRLSHPNIVRVNGVDRLDGHIVIDMEYIKGRNLQQLLRAEGRMPLERALHIAIQTLDALDYAHRMRTVHRDIKPANILLDRSDEVKLVDFGLAEILATNSYAGGAGTYAYMAPEDFSEEHHSDHLSDIWAVGVTLYEMLTASRPFQVAKAKDPFAWRKVLHTEAPTPLSAHFEMSESMDATALEALQCIMDRALARDKRERYQTCGEFRDDLIALQMQVGLSSPAQRAASDWDVKQEELSPSNGRNGHHYSENGNGHTFAPTLPLRTLEMVLPEASPMTAVAQSAPPPMVAEAPASGRKRSLLPFGKKEVLPLRATVEPAYLHFGEIRKGDERKQTVRVRFEGGQGKVNGRVASGPAWLDVTPPTFHRRSQTLTVTAFSDKVWQKGDYEDVIRLETDAGEVRIPVGIRVLKARKRFVDVALWFVPLLFAVVLPALTVAWGAQYQGAKFLVPAASLGSGLLAAMLLLVAKEADLGFGEKLASGVLLAVMTMALGLTVGMAVNAGRTEALGSLPATGVPMGLVFAVQLASRKRWQIWSAAIVVLSLITAGTFASTLAGGR